MILRGSNMLNTTVFQHVCSILLQILSLALYFCCRTESQEDGSIWVLNAPTFYRWTESDSFCELNGPACTRDEMIYSIIDSMKGSVDYGDERSVKQRPVLFIPAYIDQRMSAQSSRFLLWGEKREPLESMIQPDNYMQSTNGLRLGISNDQRFLMKIEVQSQSKHSIMRQLDVLGINDKSMFPGLDGIGRYVESHYRNNPDDALEYV